MDEAADLVGSIYSCALGNGEWEVLASRIADYCGVVNTALVVIDPRICLSQVLAPRADPDVINDYNTHWWQFDPTAAATAGIAPGRITDLTDTGRDRFYASPFYNEFWEKTGLGGERVAANLFTEGGAFGSIVLQPGDRNDIIEPESRERFSLLVPHLIEAIRAGRRIMTLEMALAGARQRSDDGILLVTSEGRILMADPRAERLAEKCELFNLSGGRLRLKDREADALLRRALSGPGMQAEPVPGAQNIPLCRDPDTVHLEVTPLVAGSSILNGLFGPVSPNGAYVVLLHDPASRRREQVELLRQAIRLTPAEARLAIEMAVGDGREAAARRCGITINTARTHLARIFEKAGVRRQSELIRRLTEMGI